MKRVKVQPDRTQKPRQSWPRWPLALLAILFVFPAFAMEYTAANSPARSTAKTAVKKTVAKKVVAKAPAAPVKVSPAALKAFQAVCGTPAAVAACITEKIDSQCIEIDAPGFANLTSPNVAGATGGDPVQNSCLAGSDHFVDWIQTGTSNTANTTGKTLVYGQTITGLSSLTTVVTFPDGTTSVIPIAAANKGNWNGVRIVDGVGGLETDQYVTGGKVEDPFGTAGVKPAIDETCANACKGTTSAAWQVNNQTVGSSKYDLSQAYLANNAQQVYFAMERVGNNGTTEFEFEFNQLAPCYNINGAACPNRSPNDFLFKFFMQGSGSSGTLTPEIDEFIAGPGGTFGSYVDIKLAFPGSVVPVFSSQNNASVAGEPWGHVNSHGNWVTGNLDAFTFGEAAIPLCLLLTGDPNCNINTPLCGKAFYVQVRTRASDVKTADLKDATPFYCVGFGGIQCLNGTDKAICKYDAAGALNTADLTVCLDPVNPGTAPYHVVWKDSGGTVVADHTGVGTTCDTFTTSVADTYSVTFTDANGCSTNVPCTVTLTVFNNPTCSVTPVNACAGGTLSWTANPSGGTGPYTYLWDNGETTQTITQSTNQGDATTGIDHTVVVTDANGCKSAGCTGTATVYANPTCSVSTADVCAGSDVTFTANPSGGSGSGFTYLWDNGATTKSITVSTSAGATSDSQISHTVVVTDDRNCSSQGCSATANVYSNPVPTIVKTAAADGQSVSVNDSTAIAGSTFLWEGQDCNNGNAYVSLGTDNPHTISSATVKLLGCSSQVVVNIGGINYKGTKWDLTIRITESRNTSPACTGSTTAHVTYFELIDPTGKGKKQIK